MRTSLDHHENVVFHQIMTRLAIQFLPKRLLIGLSEVKRKALPGRCFVDINL
ncbi:hypothetical protein OROHE_006705 [Orobanche hederae]